MLPDASPRVTTRLERPTVPGSFQTRNEPVELSDSASVVSLRLELAGVPVIDGLPLHAAHASQVRLR